MPVALGHFWGRPTERENQGGAWFMLKWSAPAGREAPSRGQFSGKTHKLRTSLGVAACLGHTTDTSVSDTHVSDDKPVPGMARRKATWGRTEFR